MRHEILKEGKFVLCDQDGYLINSSVKSIDFPYSQAVPKVIEVYQKIFGNNIHSIYVRGSVARGRAISGFSDFDCFALLFHQATPKQILQVKECSDVLKSKFDFVSTFDLFFILLDEVIQNTEFDHWRFALKIQSFCIYGTSLLPQLPEFRPNFDSAFSLKLLEKRILKAKQIINESFNSTVTKQRCSWIMRTIVRSGLELIMERDQAYTNELPLCFLAYSKYYPEDTPLMAAALELAINPVDDIEYIYSIIDPLSANIIEQRIKYYGS